MQIVIVFHRWRNTEYCTEGPDRPVKVVEKAAAIVLPSEHVSLSQASLEVVKVLGPCAQIIYCRSA
jgi:hypothetical protein